MLASLGLSATIVDARFAKPLDRPLIADLAKNHEMLLTIEEGAVGGFGSHVAHYLSGEGLLDNGLKFRSLTLPDLFIDHNKPMTQYDLAELNAPHIVKTVMNALGKEFKVGQDLA